jgi:choline dehydrogenase-like flavoprotein
METETDLLIVGSGVCGALLAARLAGRYRVTILEAGNTGPSRAALVGTYVTASKKSMGSPYRGTDADHWVPSPDGGKDTYFDQIIPEGFKATYQRRVGGSTWHWRGNVPRFVPNDFRLRSLYGVGVDWPLSYDDLEPFYGEAERELGVSGNHDEWNGYQGAYRSKPFPMSEIWAAYGDTVVADAINAIEVNGVRLRVMGTPQARNSQPYDGRPVCAGNSTCDPICPIQAKYDATSHVKKALAAGAGLYEQCVATRLVVDGRGLIEAVDYQRWDGQKGRIKARVVVVAAHAIETPRLLLLSTGANAPKGVANSSGYVGQCLMDHLQGQAAAILPCAVFPFRGPPTTSGIDSFRDGTFRSSHSAFRMSVGNDGWGSVEDPYATLVKLVRKGEAPLFGTALRDALRDRLSRQFRVSYSTETLPERENRVTLSEQLDAMGLPKPRINFRPSEYQHAAFAQARGVIERIFTTLGATEQKFSSDPNAYSSANHIIGTCRMGIDPADSVVDPYGRSHDHPNLFLAGCALFPTSGTANPTLTAAAVMLRGIREIEQTLCHA